MLFRDFQYHITQHESSSALYFQKQVRQVTQVYRHVFQRSVTKWLSRQRSSFNTTWLHRIIHPTHAKKGKKKGEKKNTKKNFGIWKSDCDSAFRTLPVCSQQQVRQIVRVKNQFYVDCCVKFGSSASPRRWCWYFYLILCIAWTEIEIEEFNNFMDDTWRNSLECDMLQFKDQSIPLNQSKYLTLFKYVAISWKWEKQDIW